MFEAFTQQTRVRRGRFLGLSLLAHALLLAIIWRAFVTPDSPLEVEPPRIRLFAPAPPPPPPAGASAVRPSPKPVVKRSTPRKIVAMPPEDTAPQEEEAAEPEGVAGGVAGGVPGGVVGGVVGAPLDFDNRMTPPRLLSGPKISYTDKALDNDVEGLMIVRCVLSVVGEVRDCAVEQGLRFMDNTVVDALEKRRYTPVTLDGRPIEVYYAFRVRLKLPR